MKRKKKKQKKDKKSEEDFDKFLKEAEENIKMRNLPEGIKKYEMELLKKQIKRAKEQEPIQFKQKMPRKIKPYSDIEIQVLKIQLDNLNHSIRKAEEEGHINFEVLRKINDYMTKETNDKSGIEYFKLLSQIYTKDPSRIEELKELRDLIKKKLEKIEENQKQNKKKKDKKGSE